ncbi:hypothetical protein QW131_28275 [Roseibium salinum]|nr:hypothetical protein [Roseibium salinum]
MTSDKARMRPEKGEHLLLQQRDRQDHIHPLGLTHLPGAVDAHDAVAAIGQDLETVYDGGPRGDLSHVDDEIHVIRYVAHGDEAAAGPLVEGNGDSAGGAQQLLLEAGRNRVGFRQNGGGDPGGGELVHQPGVAEIGNGRHVDADFGHHHEKNGEKEQLAGEPAEPVTAEAVAGVYRRGLTLGGDNGPLRRALMLHVASVPNVFGIRCSGECVTGCPKNLVIGQLIACQSPCVLNSRFIRSIPGYETPFNRTGCLPNSYSVFVTADPELAAVLWRDPVDPPVPPGLRAIPQPNLRSRPINRRTQTLAGASA